MRQSSFATIDGEQRIDLSLSRDIVSKYDDIKVVADNIDAVVTVNGAIDTFLEIRDNISSILAVAGLEAEVEALGARTAEIDSLYADKVVLDSLFADKAKLDSLFSDKAVLDSLYADKAKLDAVYADLVKVVTVAENIDDVVPVADNIANVVAVAANEANINSVAANEVNINTLSAIDTALQNLALIKTQILNLSSISDKVVNLEAMSTILSNIDTVKTDITSLNTIKTELTTLSAISTEMSSLESIKATLLSLESIHSVLVSLDAIKSTISTVSANEANISSVAANEANIDTIVANITDIQNALSNAQASAVSASEAQGYRDAALLYRNEAEGFRNETQGLAGGEVVATNVKFADLTDLETYRTSIDSAINTLDLLLQSDNLSLDTLQEIVDFIEMNRATLETLGVSNIAGLQSALDQKSADLTAHANNTSNPHAVTKTQIGLSNVDNTSDLLKPISTATQNALDAKVPTTRTVNGKALSSDITLAKTDIGLGNVDNTSDLAKPISTATQTALNGKLGSTENAVSASKLATARTIGGVSFDGSTNINLPGVNITGNQNTTGNAATATKLATARTINGVSFDGTANITVVDNTKAPISSPALIGTPTANGSELLTHADVTTSSRDTTAGRITKVGDFGLGAMTPTNITGIDLDTVELPVGFYSGNAWKNTPYGDAVDNIWGYLIVERLASDSNNYKKYTYMLNGAAGVTWTRVKTAGTWKDWKQLATTSEVGVANSPLVKTALNATGTAPIYACRAWVNFNGTGTVAIRASGNVSSITDNGTGQYTVNFITAMPDANYSVCTRAKGTATTVEGGRGNSIYSTSSVQLLTFSVETVALVDPLYVNVAIFR